MNLTFQDILNAHERIKPYIHETPILSSSALNKAYGCEFFFKYEGAQKTGSFKVRGALNALLCLKEQNQLPAYVVTFSSGNHAQAVAYAGSLLGVKVKVFFPPNPVKKKVENTERLGAEVLIAETRQAAEAKVTQSVEKEGAFFLPPFNHEYIICGQGTSCLEALRQTANTPPDAIFATCGGGGWLAGTYLAASGMNPAINVIGAEPECANDALRSYQSGAIVRLEKAPDTIADGARTLAPGTITFPYLQKLDDFIDVSETEIVDARTELETRLGVTVEPTSAVAFAAAKKRLRSGVKSKRGLILLSGANID